LDKSSDRWKKLDAQAIIFWYRQSPRLLEAYVVNEYDVPYNPPLQFPGEVLVEMDTEGRLIKLLSVPPQEEPLPGGTEVLIDWEVYFDEAGLDLRLWKQINSKKNPPFYADTRIAWQGTLPNWPESSAQIEAAAYQGKAVSFEIIAPWTKDTQAAPRPIPKIFRIIVAFALLLLTAVVAGVLIFALRNLRLGRGDRRNATRLALMGLGVIMIGWILGGHHAPTLWELDEFGRELSFALLVAGLFWIIYIAIEPFVRRRWPQILVSWTRLLSGEWRDPLVARDALIGCALGILIYCIKNSANYLIPSIFGHAELSAPAMFTFDTVLGTRFFLSQIVTNAGRAILSNLILLSALFLLRILLRSQKAAFVAFILIVSLMGLLGNWAIPAALVTYVLYLFVIMRFGLVAVVLASFVEALFQTFPIALDTSAWYSGTGYAALAILAVVVLYAFRASLGGRPLITAPNLDD
jgi:serine/threonine-protein kinase